MNSYRVVIADRIETVASDDGWGERIYTSKIHSLLIAASDSKSAMRQARAFAGYDDVDSKEGISKCVLIAENI